ncbi:hypothetical protein [Pontibacter vulgaris]|uniref:hypothetical protein n=1 Tax=Pontibacter vulgaris TaxID=2905679 RepID=UPI001FA7DFA8|nr:hypothetical protein [Pontibacter vulgaris]
MKKVTLALGLFMAALGTQAQQKPKQAKPSKELISYFAGNWTGEGKFSNGKPIAADLSFTPSLDSSWVEYRHIDKVPNTYKATSWWGLDAQSGEFVAYVFDNFGGHRKFTGDGWKNGKLTLTFSQENKGANPTLQHFIYEKLSEKPFKMTFEVSKDGTTWRMVDYLVFQKI